MYIPDPDFSHLGPGISDPESNNLFVAINIKIAKISKNLFFFEHVKKRLSH
jgi:hypothetical protein